MEQSFFHFLFINTHIIDIVIRLRDNDKTKQNIRRQVRSNVIVVGSPSLKSVSRRLIWAGHVARMEEDFSALKL